MKNRISEILLAGLLMALPSVAGAQESTAANAEKDKPEMSYAMKKSMDPNVWIKLMQGMMSGQLQGQPAIAACVDCHTNEDIARYQKDFGPMMHSMSPIRSMMNPQTMMNPMMGMMNPQTMMNPMMGMMNPQTMMNPMMGMMNPMTGMMMNPMTGMMMGPMTGMMMNPMTGMMNPQSMMNPMMGMMNPQSMMNPMMGIMNHAKPGSSGLMQQPQQMMNPAQYEKYYKQWQDMMSNMQQAIPGTEQTQ